MKRPEGNLKDEIRAYMHGLGAYRFSPVPMGFGKSGVDDFFCLRGRFIAAEAKAPGKYKHPWDGCTALQRGCLREVHAAGGISVAYDSLTDFQALLRQNGFVLP